MGNYCITTSLVDEETQKLSRKTTIQQISQSDSQSVSNKYSFLNPPLEKNYFYELRRAKDKTTQLTRGCLIFNKLNMEAQKYRQYLNQLDTIQTLAHPNIVKIFEVQEDEQNLFVVQELCSGRLNDRFISQQRNEDVIAPYIKQILGALSYCKINKIVHGDINYNNFRLENNEADSLIKIQNFGCNQQTNKNQIKQMSKQKLQWMSPQNLEGKINHKSDIYQIGIMMFNLLTNQFPFNGVDNKELIQNINKQQINFGKFKISKNAQSMIKGLLNKSEGSRFTYRQALNHVWITSNNKKNLVESGFLKQMNVPQKAQEQSKFQEITWNIIVKFFTSSKEMKTISQMFLTLDTDMDGYLSKSELIQGFKEYSTQEQAEQQAQNLLDQFDIKNTGNLNYNDFVKASVNKEKMLTTENIQIYFNLIDSDGSGSISQDELKDQFGINEKNFDQDLWDSIIDGIQFDKNNEIRFDKFQQLILNLVNKRNAIEQAEGNKDSGDAQQQSEEQPILETQKKGPINDNELLDELDQIDESLLTKQLSEYQEDFEKYESLTEQKQIEQQKEFAKEQDQINQLTQDQNPMLLTQKLNQDEQKQLRDSLVNTEDQNDQIKNQSSMLVTKQSTQDEQKQLRDTLENTEDQNDQIKIEEADKNK